MKTNSARAWPGVLLALCVVFLGALAGCQREAPAVESEPREAQATATQTIGQTCGVYMEQGCDQFTVAAAGTFLVASGATLTVEDGWTFGTLTSVEFEGSTIDDNELTLTTADPTADRTVTLADASGTVMLSTLATNAPDAANSVTGASNGLVYEGATANDYETTVSATDPTADRSIVLPDGAGTVMLSSLATNAVDAANSVTGASNALVFEGATANNFELSLVPADVAADRTLTLPDRAGTLAPAGWTVAKTTDYPVVAADVGTIFTNTGAGAGETFTLPAAADNLIYTFCTVASYQVAVDPNGTDQILALTNSGGDKITNSTPGNCVTLLGVTGVGWVTPAIYGTWADGN